MRRGPHRGTSRRGLGCWLPTVVRRGGPHAGASKTATAARRSCDSVQRRRRPVEHRPDGHSRRRLVGDLDRFAVVTFLDARREPQHMGRPVSQRLLPLDSHSEQLGQLRPLTGLDTGRLSDNTSMIFGHYPTSTLSPGSHTAVVDYSMRSIMAKENCRLSWGNSRAPSSTNLEGWGHSGSG